MVSFLLVLSTVNPARLDNSPSAELEKTSLFADKSPILAVSAINASIFAVPSIYKSLNSLVEIPKSTALSVRGMI